MNHHLRILQQRIQAVAIAARDEIHRAVHSRNAERLEWAGHEIIQGQEKNLHAGEDHSDIRHQLAILVPVDNQHGKNVNGEQEAPEQQRAFLAGPERRNFIERGERAVAVSTT